LVEYRGATIEGLSMEGRMSICNMSIEWGAKAGMVAPDDTTFSYVEGKPHAPKGAAWESALGYWRSLPSDGGAKFDGPLEAAAAGVIQGRRVHPKVRAMVVPGSTSVKLAAEKEGLDTVFKAAGFEWRNAGCSMCLGMNPDILAPGERCASTSNRNFEGRQGSGGRTHLMSPPMAAAAAI